MDPDRALSGFRVERAQTAFAAADLKDALEWLGGVESDLCPKDFVAALEYELAKAAMGQLRWGIAELHLGNIVCDMVRIRLSGGTGCDLTLTVSPSAGCLWEGS
jgi:hypothetical protein